MMNLFIAIVRFFQARKKSDRLFFLLHLLILDVNATFCPLQGVTMPIWHVNTCYIVFYFLRKVKPLRRKWTKKGENAESAMFIISTVLSYSSTAAGLATGKHRTYVGGTLAANPLSCLPGPRPTFSSVRRLTRRCCPKPAPKQCKTEPCRLRFVSASYRAPSANTPQPMIYPSRSQATISAR